MPTPPTQQELLAKLEQAIGNQKEAAASAALAAKADRVALGGETEVVVAPV